MEPTVMKTKMVLFILAVVLIPTTRALADPDPNFSGWEKCQWYDAIPPLTRRARGKRYAEQRLSPLGYKSNETQSPNTANGSSNSAQEAGDFQPATTNIWGAADCPLR
jgi:hypothetical protein